MTLILGMHFPLLAILKSQEQDSDFAKTVCRFWSQMTSMFLQGAHCWFIKLPFKTKTIVAAMKNGPISTVATERRLQMAVRLNFPTQVWVLFEISSTNRLQLDILNYICCNHRPITKHPISGSDKIYINLKNEVFGIKKSTNLTESLPKGSMVSETQFFTFFFNASIYLPTIFALCSGHF